MYVRGDHQSCQISAPYIIRPWFDHVLSNNWSNRKALVHVREFVVSLTLIQSSSLIISDRGTLTSDIVRMLCIQKPVHNNQNLGNVCEIASRSISPR